jgi:nucleoside-diphosphate-sugar epimerase
MKIFVTGASGYLGSAILADLIDHGHHVSCLARSGDSADHIKTMGAQAVEGSLDDQDVIKKAALEADAVIHCAFIHDFTKYPSACELDRKVISIIAEAYLASDRPHRQLVMTSGTFAKNKEIFTETSESNIQPHLPRGLSELVLLDYVQKGLRGTIIRIPPSVHSVHDKGFIFSLIEFSRQKGKVAYIEDGNNHWPTVHRLDAARLYRLALEKSLSGGTILHAVAEQGVRLKDIAQAISKKLTVPVVSLTPEEATEHFGPFLAAVYTTDVQASSVITHKLTDWKPEYPTLLQDLSNDEYYDRESKH